MGRSRTLVITFATVAALIAAMVATCARHSSPSDSHPLLSYIAKPDPSYAWRQTGEWSVPGQGRLLRLELTSQVWQGITWKHELDLLRPEALRYPNVALLLITGDRGDMGTLQEMARWARSAGMTAAVLFDIPNQPLFEGKREDALIAYTLTRFLETKDATWPLLYPMTKAAVRAMDAIQEAVQKEWKVPVKGFVVSGASKRGWTTWFTGASDPRVIGIAPAVYDNLNLVPQMAQQVAAYGTYSTRIRDYTERGLPQLLATPEGRRLAEMIDPYSLRHRLTMPKLILNGINDPYWTLESANLYFNDLPGVKHILYEPNAGHNLGNRMRTMATLRAFATACARGETLPPLSWHYRQRPEGLELTLQPRRKPTAASIWVASSETLDFRKALWREQRLKVSKEGTYSFTLAKPDHGYTALFGEVTYGWGSETYWLSTTPRIVR